MFWVDLHHPTVHYRTMIEEKKEIFQEDSSLLEAARQQSMQEEIANILEDFAGKIRALRAIEDISLEKCFWTIGIAASWKRSEVLWSIM